jgi:hypothetical protein
MISASARWDDTNGGLWEAEACNYPDVHGSFGPEDLKVYGDWLLHVGEANN